MKQFTVLSLIALFFFSTFAFSPALAGGDEKQGEHDKDLVEHSTDREKENDHLAVLWTSGDKEVAIKMVFMYVYSAKKSGWFEEITFIIWGPSSKLTAGDPDIQEYIKKMLDEGIVVKACKACADLYEVSDDLASFGIEVKYMGKELTDYIKSGTNLITF